MNEAVGNLWDYHEQGHFIVITTNGFVKTNGECVMGRGIAQQARDRYPLLAKMLGTSIREWGNHLFIYTPRIVTFPVKHKWMERADPALIEQSARELATLMEDTATSVAQMQVAMPRPGCGNGKLAWEDVEPILDSILGAYEDRIVVVDRKE